MGLDIRISAKHRDTAGRARSKTVNRVSFSHNLAPIAKQVGIYYPLWRASACNIFRAEQLIPFLIIAIRIMKKFPGKFDRKDTQDEAATEEAFLEKLEELYTDCQINPNAVIDAEA